MDKGSISNLRFISEAQFDIVAGLAGNDIYKMFDLLMKSGIDGKSKGFWIYDIKNHKEIYSPKFRATLEYEGKNDFPDHPDSWKQCISVEDLALAVKNLEKHIETKGEYPYYQRVEYTKKYGSKEILICHGKVVLWDGDEPLIMIGVHMANDYMFYEK